MAVNVGHVKGKRFLLFTHHTLQVNHLTGGKLKLGNVLTNWCSASQPQGAKGGVYLGHGPVGLHHVRRWARARVFTSNSHPNTAQ